MLFTARRVPYRTVQVSPCLPGSRRSHAALSPCLPSSRRPHAALSPCLPSSRRSHAALTPCLPGSRRSHAALTPPSRRLPVGRDDAMSCLGVWKTLRMMKPGVNHSCFVLFLFFAVVCFVLLDLFFLFFMCFVHVNVEQ